MEGRACDETPCGKRVKARGKCSYHYEVLRASRQPPCTVPGCRKLQYAKQVCAPHKRQLSARPGVTALELKPLRPRGNKGPCGISTCSRQEDTRGYCKRHYQQVQNYRMTEEVAELLLTQENCQICGRRGVQLVVDHDHACCPRRSRSCGGCVRGVLCVACNSGLGHLRDSPDVLRSALLYLSKV